MSAEPKCVKASACQNHARRHDQGFIQQKTRNDIKTLMRSNRLSSSACICVHLWFQNRAAQTVTFGYGDDTAGWETL
jgi:hypothetical protein